MISYWPAPVQHLRTNRTNKNIIKLLGMIQERISSDKMGLLILQIVKSAETLSSAYASFKARSFMFFFFKEFSTLVGRLSGLRLVVYQRCASAQNSMLGKFRCF